MNRKALLLLLILLVAILAGCGRSQPAPSDTAATSAPTEAPAEVAPETATEAPAEATPTEAAAEEAAAEETEAAVEEGEAVVEDAAASPLADSPLGDGGSPLATPIAAEPPALDAQTTTETGAVIGRIMLMNENETLPVSNMRVALADVLLDDDGIPRIAGYDAANAYKTTSDDLGRFSIEEVPPATYAIILDAVTTSILLADPITGDPILIEIDADALTDVGRLNYESLDLPKYKRE